MHKSKAALPVTFVLPDGADGVETWTEAPLSAEEYLARVRREAEAIPDTLVAPDYCPSASQRSRGSSPPRPPLSGDGPRAARLAVLGTAAAALRCSGGGGGGCSGGGAAAEALPELDLADEAWEARTLAQFAALRRGLARLRSGIEERHERAPEAAAARVPVPPLKAAVAWHTFCFGTEPPSTAGPHHAAPQPVESGGDDDEEEDEVDEDDGGGDDDVLSGLVLPRGHSKVHANACAAASMARGHATGSRDSSSGSGSKEEAAMTPADFVAAAEAKAAGVDWGLPGAPGIWRPPRVGLCLQLDAVATLKLLAHHTAWLEALQPLLASPHAAALDEVAGVAAADAAADVEAAVAAAKAAVAEVEAANAVDAVKSLVARGAWAFALLANLPEPLHRDSMAQVAPALLYPAATRSASARRSMP